MNIDFLRTIANIVAAVGVVICAVSGLARLLGNYSLLGYGSMTLFTVGISLMVFSMLLKLHILESQLSNKRDNSALQQK